jgi:hypothetical protein
VKRSWHQHSKRAPAWERTSAEGFVFDSKAELARWCELKLLQGAGEISNLVRQREFTLAFSGRPVLMRSGRYPNGRVCSYTADFSYTNAEGVVIVEEVKGFDTAESRLRRAVVEALYGIEIIVTGPASSKTPRKGAAA